MTSIIYQLACTCTLKLHYFHEFLKSITHRIVGLWWFSLNSILLLHFVEHEGEGQICGSLICYIIPNLWITKKVIVLIHQQFYCKYFPKIWKNPAHREVEGKSIETLLWPLKISKIYFQCVG